MSATAFKKAIVFSSFALATVFTGCVEVSETQKDNSNPGAVDAITAEQAEAAVENDSGRPVTSLYAVRTAYNDFALYRAEEPEKPFFEFKDAQSSLDGNERYKKVSLRALYGHSEEKELDSLHWVKVDLVKGLIYTDSDIVRIVDAQTLLPVQAKKADVEFVRTGINSFAVIDKNSPLDKPLYEIKEAYADNLLKQDFSGVMRVSTGKECKGCSKKPEENTIVYKINTTTGKAQLIFGDETREFQLVDKTIYAPKKPAAKPAMSAQGVAR